MQIASKDKVKIFSQIQIEETNELPNSPENGFLNRYDGELYLRDKTLNNENVWKKITGPNIHTEVETVEDLDNIDIKFRYLGFSVYVRSEGINYYLSGGIENKHWVSAGFISKFDIATISSGDITPVDVYVYETIKTFKPKNSSLTVENEILGIHLVDEFYIKCPEITPSGSNFTLFLKSISSLQNLHFNSLSTVQSTIKDLQIKFIKSSSKHLISIEYLIKNTQDILEKKIEYLEILSDFFSTGFRLECIENISAVFDISIKSRSHLISQNPDLITGLMFSLKEEDTKGLWINPGSIELNGRVWQNTTVRKISADENWYRKELKEPNTSEYIYVYADTSQKYLDLVFCREIPTRDRFFNLLNNLNNKNTLAKYHPYNSQMRCIGKVAFDESYNILLVEDLHNVNEVSVLVNKEYDYASNSVAGIVKLAIESDLENGGNSNVVSASLLETALNQKLVTKGIQDWPIITCDGTSSSFSLDGLVSEEAKNYIVILSGMRLIPNEHYTIENGKLMLNSVPPINSKLYISSFANSYVRDSLTQEQMVASRLYLYFEAPGALK